MLYKRKELNYGLTDLEPFIDYKTMNEHYNVHYKKYTDNLNQALLEGEILTDGSLGSLVDILIAYQNNNKIRNNGGGYLNHLLYFENISPYNRDYIIHASYELQMLIGATYGDYDTFMQQFIKAGADVFGSGWVWLVVKQNKLFILTTKNQDNPLMSTECRILLGMDVWEHAYYLKHMADRMAYMKDFFRTIDWQVVSDRL
jgi:Fe-Mn family superoxide dismutase